MTTTTARKRDSSGKVVHLPSARIQTSGFDTRLRESDDNPVEESLSPRTAVSARFRGLNLQHALGPNEKTRRRSSLTTGDDPTATSQPSVQPYVFREIEPEEQGSPLRLAATSSANPVHSTHATSGQSSLGMDDAVFEFTAGDRRPTPPPMSELGPARTPSIKHVQALSKASLSTPSPTKRRRHEPRSPSPTSTPIPRSQSPSARKLSVPGKRTPSSSGSSNDADLSDTDLAALWWQDSEITGYDATDPEEDSRGVNGIGYQKTKSEASRIAEKKRRQIAEWRSRETKEARALRAGDRQLRVMGGRVTKVPSRGGSPVERKGSPAAARREKDVESSSPRKGVRFEVG